MTADNESYQFSDNGIGGEHNFTRIDQREFGLLTVEGKEDFGAKISQSKTEMIKWTGRRCETAWELALWPRRVSL